MGPLCRAKVELRRGRPHYVINVAHDEAHAFVALVARVLPGLAMHREHGCRWVVHCPTWQLAGLLHRSVKADASMATNVKHLSETVDVWRYEDFPPPSVTLCTSEYMFETKADGVLPKSVMIMGAVYDFKELIKSHFRDIKYAPLIFNGGTLRRSAWVLPVSGQTFETGTLADFLITLGFVVEEVDLDIGDGSDDSDDSSDCLDSQVGDSSDADESDADDAGVHASDEA